MMDRTLLLTIVLSHKFYSSNVNLTPESVKYNYEKKYPQKLLVYLAISPEGVSMQYFFPSGLAVNKEIYLEK